MTGEKLGNYRLTAKIGEGGMGVVYRARDEELNRDVAVKVLAAGMLDHLGKDHLLREAQTASALNHPNICNIYQIGRVDDGFYLVMELIEGQPFNELARSGGYLLRNPQWKAVRIQRRRQVMEGTTHRTPTDRLCGECGRRRTRRLVGAQADCKATSLGSKEHTADNRQTQKYPSREDAEATMTLSFWIPGPLRTMTGGSGHVDVETAGDTLQDALEALFIAYPAIRDRILTERGEIREHVNVFVGKTESRLTGGLATPLTDASEISIIPAISGG